MFENHKAVEECFRNAGTISAADWRCFLGDTFAEKFESLYVKIVELSNVIVRKGFAGYFWLVCSPETFAVIQSGGKMQYEYAPRFVKSIVLRGLLEGEWRVYTDADMKPGQVLIGSSSSSVALDMDANPRRFATLTLANFIEKKEKEDVEEILANMLKAKE